MSAESENKSSLLCNIDLLRGIAAISILFWHYQHFYYPRAGVSPIARGEVSRAAQPLFDWFSWFYLHGALAVHFFWILSGFIFFHVYAPRQDIGLRDFLVNRLSRLYPLHFLTLCLVALLQWVSWSSFGNFQIYPANDAWHFVLNLFMASHWGFQKGYSFNAPIWSISVEMLTYGMFFAFLKTARIQFLSSLLWLGWSLILYKNSAGPVFECAVLFALGGVLNQGHAWLNRGSVGRGSVYGAVAAVLLAIAAIYWGWLWAR